MLHGVLDIGRGAVASEMVGLSEEVFNRTVEYLKSRKQFGKLIGEFQALQHRAAELYVDIEITRAAVMKALQALDTDVAKAASAVAVAKARAGTTATRAVQEGVQMHGGMGMTDQFDIGFFMKRARVRGIVRRRQLPHRAAGKGAGVLRRTVASHWVSSPTLCAIAHWGGRSSTPRPLSMRLMSRSTGSPVKPGDDS